MIPYTEEVLEGDEVITPPNKPKKPSMREKFANWRNARKARKLRKPIKADFTIGEDEMIPYAPETTDNAGTQTRSSWWQRVKNRFGRKSGTNVPTTDGEMIVSNETKATKNIQGLPEHKQPLMLPSAQDGDILPGMGDTVPPSTPKGPQGWKAKMSAWNAKYADNKKVQAASGLGGMVGMIGGMQGFTSLADSLGANSSVSSMIGFVGGMGTQMLSAFGPAGAIASGILGMAGGLFSAIKEYKEKEHQEVMNSIKEASDAYKENRSKLKEIEDQDFQNEFELLSRGVDKNGQNVSLSTEEYENYQSAVEKLTEGHEELIKGYNEEGQAIIDRDTLLEKSIELTKEQMRLDKLKIYNKEALENTAEDIDEKETTDWDNRYNSVSDKNKGSTLGYTKGASAVSVINKALDYAGVESKQNGQTITRSEKDVIKAFSDEETYQKMKDYVGYFGQEALYDLEKYKNEWLNAQAAWDQKVIQYNNERKTQWKGYAEGEYGLNWSDEQIALMGTLIDNLSNKELKDMSEDSKTYNKLSKYASLINNPEVFGAIQEVTNNLENLSLKEYRDKREVAKSAIKDSGYFGENSTKAQRAAFYRQLGLSKGLDTEKALRNKLASDLGAYSGLVSINTVTSTSLHPQHDKNNFGIDDLFSLKYIDKEDSIFDNIINEFENMSLSALDELNKNYETLMIDDLVKEIKDGSRDAKSAIEEMFNRIKELSYESVGDKTNLEWQTKKTEGFTNVMDAVKSYNENDKTITPEILKVLNQTQDEFSLTPQEMDQALSDGKGGWSLGTNNVKTLMSFMIRSMFKNNDDISIEDLNMISQNAERLGIHNIKNVGLQESIVKIIDQGLLTVNENGQLVAKEALQTSKYKPLYDEAINSDIYKNHTNLYTNYAKTVSIDKFSMDNEDGKNWIKKTYVGIGETNDQLVVTDKNLERFSNTLVTATKNLGGMSEVYNKFDAANMVNDTTALRALSEGDYEAFAKRAKVLTKDKFGGASDLIITAQGIAYYENQKEQLALQAEALDSVEFEKSTLAGMLKKEHRDATRTKEDLEEKKNDLLKEARLSKLKIDIDLVQVGFDKLNKTISTLSSNLDLLNEKDGIGRFDLLSQQLFTVNELSSDLTEEWNRLEEALGTAQSGEEIQTILDQMNAISDSMTDSAQKQIQLEKEMNNVLANGFADRISNMKSIVDRELNLLDAQKKKHNSKDFVFYNVNAVGSFGNIKREQSEYDKKRQESQKIIQEEKERQEKIADLRKQSLEAIYQEEETKRKRELKRVGEDLADAMAKVETTTVESMKKTIQETLDAITAAIDSWNAQDHSMIIRAELRDWTTEHINDNKYATKFKSVASNSKLSKEERNNQLKSEAKKYAQSAILENGESSIYDHAHYMNSLYEQNGLSYNKKFTQEDRNGAVLRRIADKQTKTGAYGFSNKITLGDAFEKAKKSNMNGNGMGEDNIGGKTLKRFSWDWFEAKGKTNGHYANGIYDDESINAMPAEKALSKDVLLGRTFFYNGEAQGEIVWDSEHNEYRIQTDDTSGKLKPLSNYFKDGKLKGVAVAYYHDLGTSYGNQIATTIINKTNKRVAKIAGEKADEWIFNKDGSIERLEYKQGGTIIPPDTEVAGSRYTRQLDKLFLKDKGTLKGNKIANLFNNKNDFYNIFKESLQDLTTEISNKTSKKNSGKENNIFGIVKKSNEGILEEEKSNKQNILDKTKSYNSQMQSNENTTKNKILNKTVSTNAQILDDINSFSVQLQEAFKNLSEQILQNISINPEDYSDNEAFLFDYFVNQGYNAKAASAIIGNLKNESGGTINPKADNGTHKGIAQWSSSRWAELVNRAGTDNPTLMQQADFLIWELQHKKQYKDVNNTLLNDQQTLDAMTESFYRYYEVPYLITQKGYYPELRERQKDAKTTYKNYGIGGANNVNINNKTIDGHSITSEYNISRNLFGTGSKSHKGLDLAYNYEPIYANKPLTIVTAGNVSGFGKAIYAQDKDGYTYIFGHLSDINVKAGQTVKQGQKLGVTGNTGKSTGPHLHYEVHNAQGETIDPRSKSIVYSSHRSGEGNDSVDTPTPVINEETTTETNVEETKKLSLLEEIKQILEDSGNTLNYYSDSFIKYNKEKIVKEGEYLSAVYANAQDDSVDYYKYISPIVYYNKEQTQIANQKGIEENIKGILHAQNIMGELTQKLEEATLKGEDTTEFLETFNETYDQYTEQLNQYNEQLMDIADTIKEDLLIGLTQNLSYATSALATFNNELNKIVHNTNLLFDTQKQEKIVNQMKSIFTITEEVKASQDKVNIITEDNINFVNKIKKGVETLSPGFWEDKNLEKALKKIVNADGTINEWAQSSFIQMLKSLYNVNMVSDQDWKALENLKTDEERKKFMSDLSVKNNIETDKVLEFVNAIGAFNSYVENASSYYDAIQELNSQEEERFNQLNEIIENQKSALTTEKEQRLSILQGINKNNQLLSDWISIESKLIREPNINNKAINLQEQYNQTIATIDSQEKYAITIKDELNNLIDKFEGFQVKFVNENGKTKRTIINPTEWMSANGEVISAIFNRDLNNLQLAADQAVQQGNEKLAQQYLTAIASMENIATMQGDYTNTVNELGTTLSEAVSQLDNIVKQQAEWMKQYITELVSGLQYNIANNKTLQSYISTVTDSFGQFDRDNKQLSNNAEIGVLQTNSSSLLAKLNALKKETSTIKKDISDITDVDLTSLFSADGEKHAYNYAKFTRELEENLRKGVITNNEYTEVLAKLETYEETLKQEVQTQDDIIKNYQEINTIVQEQIKLAIENYDWQIKKQETLLSLKEKQFETENKIYQLRLDLDKELRSAKQTTQWLTKSEREKIFNEENYTRLYNALDDMEQKSATYAEEYYERIMGLTEDTLYQQEYITNEYERRLALVEMEYNITKQRVDLEKKQMELSNVLAEKNSRVYINGEWAQVANIEDVRNASEQVADIEAELKLAEEERLQKIQTNQMQDFIDSLKENQAALENSMQYTSDTNQELIDKLSEFIGSIVGEDLGGDSLNKKVRNVVNSVDNLDQSLNVLINKNIKNAIDTLQELNTSLEGKIQDYINAVNTLEIQTEKQNSNLEQMDSNLFTSNSKLCDYLDILAQKIKEVIGDISEYVDRDTLLAEMQENAEAWHTASDDEKTRLQTRNEELGELLGLEKNPVNGRWYTANGKEALDYSAENKTLLAEMQENATRWATASETEQETLQNRNKYLGNLLGLTQKNDGKWYTTNGKEALNYSQMPTAIGEGKYTVATKSNSGQSNNSNRFESNQNTKNSITSITKSNNSNSGSSSGTSVPAGATVIGSHTENGKVVYDWVKKAANGDRFTTESIYNIDEIGKELLIPPIHSGRYVAMEYGSQIVPHNLSENILKWGAINPASINANKPEFTSNLTNNTITYSIGEIKLDNVTNGENFIPELNRYLQRTTTLNNR